MRKMSDVFHFVGNVNPVVIEQIFLLSVSSLSGTCTNFLELFTQRLGLLLAETISFQEPVRRKRKCVLTTVSQCRMKEAAESSACVCGCGTVRECVCQGAVRLQREWRLRGKEQVSNNDKVVCNACGPYCSGRISRSALGLKGSGWCGLPEVGEKIPKNRFFFFLKRVYWISCNIVSVLYSGFFWPWGMRDFSFLTRDQTCSLCIERWILNLWTARQVPKISKNLDW